MANVFRGPLYSLKGLVRPLAQFLTANLLLTTLAIVPGPAPFAQTDWPISPPRVELRVEPPPNLLGTTLAPTVAAPFTQGDWPLPRRLPTRDLTWTQSILREALGVDPRTQTDWPISFPWVEFRVELPPNLLGTTLAPSVAAPFTQLDWSFLVRPPTKDLTWTQGILREALGVDPRTQTDWPLPRERKVREDLTWVWTALPEILAKTEPFVQTNWLLQREPVRQNLTQEYQVQLVLRADFKTPDVVVFDWPLPREIPRPNLTWTQNLLQSTLFVEPLPFRQLDWPLAVLRYNRDLSWVHDLGVLASARTDPFISLDFPVIQRVVQQDFIVVPNLLTNTLATVEAAPFVQLDWPNPPKIAYSIVIPNWICIRNLPLQAAVCAPSTSFVMILND